MTKHYFHLLIILLLAWTLYGLCQEDVILPMIAGGLAVLTYLLRLNSGERAFAWAGRLPLAVVLLTSLIAGIAWRTFTPAPAAASAIYIGIISVWQSASVIASAILWLTPFTLKNIYRLTATSWVIVALSINVPFDGNELLLFRLFCVFSVVNILIHALPRPPLKSRHGLHCRQLLIYGLLLVVITGFFFRNIAFGLRVFDRLFMSFVGDYLLPRDYTHFLNISPFLQLTNPGYSALDKRPVLEIDGLGYASIYLKTQVFDTYQSSAWKEPENVQRSPLSDTLSPELPKTNMFMYVALKNIVPSPYVVASGKTHHDTFIQDANDIVYADEIRRTRILSFSLNPPAPVVIEPGSEDFKALTQVPEKLMAPLAEIAGGIVPAGGSDWEKAMALQKYFHNNFQYTLNVDFHASEAGVLKMLQEKRPAYCSYFATAITLLLRSQGIPARVAVGFFSQQKTGPDNSRFLVRVRNAHAWAEALVPFQNPYTQETYLTWVPFDPTPAMAMNEAIEQGGSRLNELADRLWLFLLRTVAHLSNIDKEQAKRGALFILILGFILINLKKIVARFAGLRFLRRVRKRTGAAKYKDLEAIYFRYEDLILKNFSESRLPEETDAQLLLKLKKRGVAEEKLLKLNSFVDSYRQVRFGGARTIALEGCFEKLRQDILYI
ncbi:MAG TPA: transglutaminase-like domain-containing protein [Candidatus Omnitrophota bacterium]|nr:transglutaminase-like domain-containing protein [Candidatus Omnitrophota bacterium]